MVMLENGWSRMKTELLGDGEIVALVKENEDKNEDKSKDE